MASSENRYLALLRGINVGGKNIIPMQDLRKCLADIGLSKVRTYIQSGNVLFRSDENRVPQLTKLIETELASSFQYEARCVVIGHAKYRKMIGMAPPEWGENEQWKYNAMFLLPGTTAKKILESLPPPRPDIETVSAGSGVIFWSASRKDLTRSTLMKLAASPAYQKMTVRNSNTTHKLLRLFDEI